MRSVDFSVGWYWVEMLNGEWNRIYFSAQQMAWQFFRMPAGRPSVAQQLGIERWAFAANDVQTLRELGILNN